MRVDCRLSAPTHRIARPAAASGTRISAPCGPSTFTCTPSGSASKHAGERAAHSRPRSRPRRFPPRRVDELGLGAQHEHRQALLHRGLHVVRQPAGASASPRAPHQERRQQAALRRAIAGQARLWRRRDAGRRWSTALCRKLAASSPLASITPNCVQRQEYARGLHGGEFGRCRVMRSGNSWSLLEVSSDLGRSEQVLYGVHPEPCFACPF